MEKSGVAETRHGREKWWHRDKGREGGRWAREAEQSV